MAIAWTTLEDALHAWVVAGSGLAATQVQWSQQKAPRPSGAFISMMLTDVRSVGQDWAEVYDNPLVLADDVVESVDATANTLTLTAHAYLTGDGPVRLTTTGTLPVPLALATDYWVIKSSANAIKLAASHALAIAASPTALDVTDAGTGTHTIVDTADTVRSGAEVTYRARGARQATLRLQAFAAAAHGASTAAGLLESVRAAAALPTRRGALIAAGIGIADFGPTMRIDGVIGSSTFEPRGAMDVTLNLVSEITENAGYIQTLQVELLDEEGAVLVPEFEVDLGE